ncbi:MAG TPA: UDP-glucose 4-epimerase GalE [Gemmatimonadales bacterium]|jgi:UDP-glucose 4-epimerase|nr:UDP-glucose 4-epimerase GalE [Gemmatimonadales bacterium]
MAILVTGGAGYIGSHTCLELLRARHDVIVVDNLCNSHEEALRRVRELAGGDLVFHRADLRDAGAMEGIFRSGRIESVLHFAGLKAVGESVEKPLLYWDNNVGGTLVLLETMARHGVKTLVFSSSCTVYGDPTSVPIPEDSPLSAVNPYGMTKLTIERILADVHRADPSWDVAVLRYFNPVGADPSARIGEDPNGIPNNLVPFITQVAVGKIPALPIHGSDYPTRDGTGVRDYIHVTDLAVGHLLALNKLGTHPGLAAWNLGTGTGYSVLEIVHAFERAIGRAIPYRIGPRRAGDVAESWADPTRARDELGWCATRSLDEICADSWRWQLMNPDGYADRT